jgi:hypothetical protein
MLRNTFKARRVWESNGIVQVHLQRDDGKHPTEILINAELPTGMVKKDSEWMVEITPVLSPVSSRDN